jgi:hypothetical protein
MFAKLKKGSFLKKKQTTPDSSSGDTLQSLRSWIRKIEQSTTSVSSRLSAVEKRISGGMTEGDAVNKISIQGPIETFVRNRKKRNAGDLAHMLDSELTLLHNEMVQQEQDFLSLKSQLTSFEEKYAHLTTEIHSIRVMTTQMDEKIEFHKDRYGRREPFMMRLGTMEIPIEFTGIIGGFLAFIIAVLVAIDQKAVLLSPIFLSTIGFLLIGFAMVKMVRTRSRSTLLPTSPMLLTTRSSAQLTSTQYEQKEVNET